MRRTGTHLGAVAIICAVAVVLFAGGGAYASPKVPAARSSSTTRLTYVEGKDVVVGSDSTGSAATKCPKGEYPIGGGPSSPNAVFMEWSDPAKSTSSAKYPNEWTVGIFNGSSSNTVVKAFVVCTPAGKVSSNY